MKEEVLESWEHFIVKMRELERYRNELIEQSDSHVSEILYRGQADAQWTLRSTLERAAQNSDFAVYHYLRILKRIQPQIGAFTKERWILSGPREILAEINEDDFFRLPTNVYEFIAHLRHHGFPTPLIDWTESPFIAAYFAFSGLSEADRVAIFAYIEYTGAAKGGVVDEPTIVTMGPFIRTHRRHFLQRSNYSYCRRRIGGKWSFTTHEDAFGRNEHDQDLLWKFTLPSAEARTALEYLDMHNITAFSLFSSEESLMDSLSVREFILNRR